MRLNHVTVATHDVEHAIAFYRMLGLQLIVHSPHYARFVCSDGQSTLSVHRSDHPVAASTVVYFECADLDGTVTRLIDAGLHFDLMPTDQPWLWREARLVDPDRNPICLFSAGRNRLDPPWRVAGDTRVA